MIYLLIFYWIFAALFIFGVNYVRAKAERKPIFGVFLGCIMFGGILFPVRLGLEMNKICTAEESNHYEY